MTSFLDERYLLLISNRLERFKKTGNHVYVCRCKFCGDSQKNKYKARGYFYEMKDMMCYHCKNCDYGCSFSNFLKDLDINLHRQYLFEKFKDSNKYQQPLDAKPEPKISYDISTLVSINNLPDAHKAKKYIVKRKIPKEFWNRIFYSENYMKWINDNIIPNKFDISKIPEKDERIVLPFYRKDGTAFAFSGRSLSNDPNVTRYLHVKEGKELLLYGLDRVDLYKTLYLSEGQFDSLMVTNCLAASGSSLNKLLKSESDIVFMFDNEGRSKQIVGLMEEIIKSGRKIFIWDDTYDVKDINELVMKYDVTQANLMKYIKKRTFQGLYAQLEFGKFKKI